MTKPLRAINIYTVAMSALLLACLLTAAAPIYVFFFQWPRLPIKADIQAVFLANGQVYFGRVGQSNLKYVELTDIYYLQLEEQLQGDGAPKEIKAPDLSLLKLGNELHGPEDRMIITKDHIVFIEDLKEDSKVVEAIRANKLST